MSSTKMKNKEIAEQFAAELATGSPFIFAVSDEIKTSGKDGSQSVAVHFVQMQDSLNILGGASDFLAEARGWTGQGEMVRTILNVDPKALEKTPDVKAKYTTVGNVFRDATIQVVHNNAPDKNRPAHLPKLKYENEIAFVLVDPQGLPVFEHTSLVKKEKDASSFKQYYEVSNITATEWEAKNVGAKSPEFAAL